MKRIIFISIFLFLGIFVFNVSSSKARGGLYHRVSNGIESALTVGPPDVGFPHGVLRNRNGANRIKADLDEDDEEDEEDSADGPTEFKDETLIEAITNSENSQVEATYNEEKGKFTYTDSEGDEHTVDVADIPGITKKWLSSLELKDGDKVTFSIADEEAEDKIVLITAYQEEGKENKAWQYDTGNHLMAHYHTEGELKGRLDCITSESTRDYQWAGEGEIGKELQAHEEIERGEGYDPGKVHNHVVVQKNFYDEEGNLDKKEYYTWTAGDVKGKENKKYRYLYKRDTIVGESSKSTEYFDDPLPVSWDPKITGKLVEDSYGRYFLKDGDKYYKITTRIDGFDLDGDGKSGAEELNEVDLESLVGEEITVRGHHVEDDNEEGIYYNGNKAETFSVVDIVEEGEELKEGWKEIDKKAKGILRDRVVDLPPTGSNEFDFEVTADKLEYLKKLVPLYKEEGITKTDVEEFGTPLLNQAWEEVDTADEGTDSGAEAKEDGNAADEIKGDAPNGSNAGSFERIGASSNVKDVEERIKKLRKKEEEEELDWEEAK